MTRRLLPVAMLLLAAATIVIGCHARTRAQSSADTTTQHAPIYVWIQPSSGVRDFRASDTSAVADAFEAWNGIVPQVRFAFTDDSATAAARVIWVDHLPPGQTGEARLMHDDDGLVTDASVTLAVHHADGRVMRPDEIRALAMHEVGHLVGLPHSTDPRSIMAPVVRVRTLAPADSAALRHAR